jgi:hypothetical protein
LDWAVDKGKDRMNRLIFRLGFLEAALGHMEPRRDSSVEHSVLSFKRASRAFNRVAAETLLGWQFSVLEKET